MHSCLALQEGDEGTLEPPKTLYKVCKQLQSKHGGADLKITSYGSLISHMDKPGSHGYSLEFPKEHQKHNAKVYVCRGKESSQTTAGNVFRPCASKLGFKGSVGVLWRVTFNDVTKLITARKPMVMTTVEIHLQKGMPKLIATVPKHEA